MGGAEGAIIFRKIAAWASVERVNREGNSWVKNEGGGGRLIPIICLSLTPTNRSP